MIRKQGKLASAILSVAVIGMTISGCGKRGALETPKPADPKPAVVNQPGGSGKSAKKETGKSGRYFFLDILIR